jgi:Fe-S-cluster containining protein
MSVQQTIGLLRREVNFEYPATVRFRCTKCGICCGDTKEKTRHILLLKPEAEQIAKATSKSILAFAEKIENQTPYVYEMKKTPEDGKCIFLENNRCTVYPLRPLICRFYPFELKTAHGRRYTFLFTEECPGINKGRILSEAYFRKIFRLAQAKCRQTKDPAIASQIQ